MFFTIIPESPPVFAVQPNDALITAQSAAELIERLERHFMSPIVLVCWDQSGQFQRYGYPASEEAVTSEDIQWREFELPPEPEVPF
jgi:hypothetical protein